MTTQECLRVSRTRAIVVGGHSLDPGEERVAHPVDLLAAAIGGLAELTAAAIVGLDLADCTLPGIAVERARRQARMEACRALRLCQRALEADARNAGYDWRPWVDATIHDTALRLERRRSDPPSGDSLRHAEGLARSLGQACRALAYDRMAFPEALSLAQTHALILVIAAESQDPASRLGSAGR